MAARHELSPDRISQLKQKRRAKKKARKQRLAAANASASTTTAPTESAPTSLNDINLVVDQPIQLPPAREWQALASVIEHFSIPSTLNDTTTAGHEQQHNRGSEHDNNGATTPAISKKKLKRLAQLTVDELRQLADVPRVVEPWDATAPDPELLVTLKSYRNTVPVPWHWWWRKRGYLQRKERPSWQLPEYILQTGIADKRDAMREKEAKARAGAKRRARLNPKLGKMDVDYQKLHDAFFRYPIRVELSRHGELYYEGKEYGKPFKPGRLSTSLRDALQIGPADPPPWLFAMQRAGPPPAYPGLKLPGVNAPIPEGAQLGHRRGGWGEPPMIRNKSVNDQDQKEKQAVDKTLWGELDPELEYKDTEEQEEEKETGETLQSIEMEDEGDVPVTEMDVVSGDFELRKRTPSSAEEKQDVNDQNEEAKQLYHVLSHTSRGAMQGFMASRYTYNLPITRAAQGHDVDVSVEDPSDLENTSALASKYEQAQGDEHRPHSVATHEDLSDMYIEHASRQAKKLKQQEKLKESRKKEFRF